MKIAIFSDNFYPELSGISDSIILLAKELAKSGHEIKFFAPRYNSKNYEDINLPAKELELGDNIKIKRLISLPAKFAGMQSRLAVPLPLKSLFKEFKPDVIHTQLFFGVGLIAWRMAKNFNIPLIGTNHTAISEFAKLPYLKIEIVKKASLKYAVWYYSQCDFVTAPSASVFKEMIKYDFKKPCLVISNPIDTVIFSASNEKNNLKKKLGLSDQTVICAGRLAPEKNINVVIKALALAKKKVKNINLAIAGSGKSEEELKLLTKKLKLEKAVKFLGSLSKTDLAELYQASEIFAIASTSETQSLVLMQAMACGLPAVAVNSRALPEYVNAQNGFIVKPGDHKAMAEKFVYLFKNESERQKLGQGAYDYVQKFSAPNIARQWEEIYQKVIKDY